MGPRPVSAYSMEWPRTDRNAMKVHWASLTDWSNAVEAARLYWNHSDCDSSCQDHHHCAPFQSYPPHNLTTVTLEAVNQLLDWEILPYSMMSEHHRGPEEWEDYSVVPLNWWQEEDCRTFIHFLLPTTELPPEVISGFLERLKARTDLLVVIRFPGSQSFECNFDQSTCFWLSRVRTASTQYGLRNKQYQNPTLHDRPWNLRCGPDPLSYFSEVGCNAVVRASPIDVRIYSKKILEYRKLMNAIHSAWRASQ